MELLSHYKKVGIEAASVQLAILETVTYGNVMQTATKQGLDKAANVLNGLRALFGARRQVSNSNSLSITDQVLCRSEYWKEKPLDSITSALFWLLAERLDTSDDLNKISTQLILEAAAGFGIDEDLLLGQQAELVAKQYWKETLEQIRKQLAKQDPTEARATEQLIAQRLREMTPSERLEMQRTLGLSSVTAENVRGAFLQAGGPLVGIALVQMSGFGAYLALTTIMHALFTTILGMTLPFAAYTTATSILSFLTGPVGIAISLSIGALGYVFSKRKMERAQYAMVVWACVTHMERPVVAATSMLPSNSRGFLLLEAKVSETHVTETELSNLQHSKDQLFKDATVEVIALQRKCDSKETAFAAIERKVSNLQAKLEKAEARLREAETRALVDEATERSNAFLREALAKEMAETSRTLAREKICLAEAQAKLDQELNWLKEASARLEEKTESRKRQIEQLWAIHFKAMTFGSQPLRWSAQKTFLERLEIERALVELKEAPDPVALSRSKMRVSGEHHSAFTLAQGVPCRIFYRVNYGGIHIERIAKKSEI